MVPVDRKTTTLAARNAKIANQEAHHKEEEAKHEAEEVARIKDRQTTSPSRTRINRAHRNRPSKLFSGKKEEIG